MGPTNASLIRDGERQPMREVVAGGWWSILDTVLRVTRLQL